VQFVRDAAAFRFLCGDQTSRRNRRIPVTQAGYSLNLAQRAFSRVDSDSRSRQHRTIRFHIALVDPKHPHHRGRFDAGGGPLKTSA
jgi:hypothetical protein